MFNPADEPTTYEEMTRRELAAYARAVADYEARMEMFEAGRVSFGAAFAGGDEYAAEMRESERVDELVAEPIAAALNGWVRAMEISRKAA